MDVPTTPPPIDHRPVLRRLRRATYRNLEAQELDSAMRAASQLVEHGRIGDAAREELMLALDEAFAARGIRYR